LMKLGGGNTARWSGTWCVLDILSMLSNKSRTELGKFLSELRDDLGADKVFDGCFRASIRVDVYVENILIFFSIMSNLRDCDCATDILFVLGGT